MARYGTILVVDDNTSIFTTLEICLDGVFDRILTLTKPESILTMLEQETVDVVLLDMNFSLGVNNGQEGLLWVQAVHRRHPHIPIVLMTAYADVKLAVKGLKSGAVDFLTMINIFFPVKSPYEFLKRLKRSCIMVPWNHKHIFLSLALPIEL